MGCKRACRDVLERYAQFEVFQEDTETFLNRV